MKDNYSEGFIVFMDILGFSAYVEKNKSIIKLKKINDFTEKIMSLYNSNNISGIKIAFFSDSFVLTTEEKTVQSFNSLMIACHLINISIFNSIGLFTRGAVTFGEFYHEDNIAFGPGIIQAYRIEDNDSKYVRMVIAENVEKMLDTWDCKGAWIQRASDGFWYFNWYMLSLDDAIEKDGFNFNKAEEIMNQNRKIILEILEKYQDSSVYNKYLWLIEEFNECCKVMISKSLNNYSKFIIET